MKNDKHVIGVFDNRVKAQSALDTLVNRDFDPSQLSMLVSENGRDHHFEIDKNKSKTAEGAGYGSVLGGLIAGLGVAAAGIVSVTVPGAILISGPLAVSFAAGATGATLSSPSSDQSQLILDLEKNELQSDGIEDWPLIGKISKAPALLIFKIAVLVVGCVIIED